jgi:hypothetical protein
MGIGRFVGRAARGLEKLLQDLDETANIPLNQATRRAAERIVADLQEAGPGYSGHFGNSWVIEPGDVQVPATSAGGGGPQAIRPIRAPLLSGAQTAQEIRYTIGNRASYRDQAMDLRPGRFFKPDFDPIKKPVAKGGRFGDLRPDVKAGEGDAISTAQRDWFTTYVEGGQIDERVRLEVEPALNRIWRR